MSFLCVETRLQRGLGTSLILSFAKHEEDRAAGRNALLSVSKRLGLSLDIDALRFPHPHFSLSHSGGTGAAIAWTGTDNFAGIGIDIERKREIDPRSARFFLREEERFDLKHSQDNLLRLWTVKEALFKADPDNRDQGVRDYIVDSAHRMLGKARHIKTGRTFLYQSERTEFGFLTVALAQGT